ncbi:hypothetical protein Ancab_033555, partial [Ancistrocladus abbreviatus]
KARERELAFKHASLSSSSGVVKSTRKVAEYMRYVHELSNEAEANPNPNSMVGYRYLVGVKNATMEWISPSYRQKLKQILSLPRKSGSERGGFELNRYAGYPLYKCSHDKTWRFVPDRLFFPSRSKDNDDDFKVDRASRVIEVELHFLYDYFRTKYYAIYSRGIPKKLV